jgi:hypothetical protein
MALLTADEMKKGTDASGTPVATFVNGAGRHFQGIVVADKYGNIVGGVASAGSEPTKVQIPAAATDPTLVLASNEARQGFWIWLRTGSILFGLNNRSNNLTNFRTHASLWIATMMFPPPAMMAGLGVYKGPVYAAVPSGGVDTDLFVQEY